MTQSTEATTIRHQVTVDAPIERAFAVFTEDFGRFKPREHNLLGVDIAEGPDRTRVELEHRHLDRHLEGWQGVRDGVDADGGWPLYLRRYAELLAT
ncbi:MAG TPA: hypothetical protein VNZ62_10150 [Capillimicrobium sp.]|nr:hypothetical protein [Capillimicrobium sp.]